MNELRVGEGEEVVTAQREPHHHAGDGTHAR